MAVCHVCGTDCKRYTSTLHITNGLPVPQDYEICWKCQSEILQDVLDTSIAPIGAMIVNIINAKKAKK